MWCRRHQRHGVDGHAFFFGLSNGYVIDGRRGCNSARWLNHACAPNCEAVEDAGRVFIEAIRDIEAGDELSIEYQLAVDDPLDERVRQQYGLSAERDGLSPVDASCCRMNTLPDALTCAKEMRPNVKPVQPAYDSMVRARMWSSIGCAVASVDGTKDLRQTIGSR